MTTDRMFRSVETTEVLHMSKFLLTIAVAAMLVAAVLAGSYLFGTSIEPATDWSTLHACAELSRAVAPSAAADVLAECAR